MPDALHIALLRSYLECVAFLELSDESEVDTRLAIKTMERSGFWLDQLPEPDKTALVALIEELAAQEPEGPRRDFFMNIPSDFGLVDDEDDSEDDDVPPEAVQQTDRT